MLKRCTSCPVEFEGRRSRCPSCYSKYRWASSPTKYDSAKDLGKHRKYQLKVKFGITLEQYNSMLAFQRGVCSICEKPCSTGRHLAVDHNHTTGKVRALLCSNCNTAIGKLQDSPELLERAAAYLRSH